jgi:hypothetical protein
VTRPPCPAITGQLTCCRLGPHPMPHLAPDGTQWDEHGVRQNRGNDPWKGEVA